MANAAASTTANILKPSFRKCASGAATCPDLAQAPGGRFRSRRQDLSRRRDDVDAAERFSDEQNLLAEMLDSHAFARGARYADYREGDRVAPFTVDLLVARAADTGAPGPDQLDADASARDGGVPPPPFAANAALAIALCLAAGVATILLRLAWLRRIR